MKHCPACNFSFPDFHQVCDFDGTKLMSDPERLSLVKTPPPPPRLWRLLKSPVLWAGLLLAAVLSSAFLVAYYDATRQSSPAVKDQPEPTPVRNAASVARASSHSAAAKEPLRTLPHHNARNLNRVRQSASARRRSQAAIAPTIARRDQKPGSSPTVREGVKQTSSGKEPKFTAMLKTTWRVLKKPFKF